MFKVLILENRGYIARTFYSVKLLTNEVAFQLVY